MNEELSFNLLLDQNPDDHLTRLVYADWLQDHDDIRAAGYRKLGELQVTPLFQTHCSRMKAKVEGRLEDWGYSHFGREYDYEDAEYEGHLLALEWFNQMYEAVKKDRPDLDCWDWWCFFESRKQAEDAAATAYYYL